MRDTPGAWLEHRCGHDAESPCQGKIAKWGRREHLQKLPTHACTLHTQKYTAMAYAPASLARMLHMHMHLHMHTCFEQLHFAFCTENYILWGLVSLRVGEVVHSSLDLKGFFC